MADFLKAYYVILFLTFYLSFAILLEFAHVYAYHYIIYAIVISKLVTF